jgi:hypothetical protein
MMNAGRVFVRYAKKGLFIFRIPPANCVDQKSARSIYEITPRHPFDPAFSWVDAVAAVASADFEAIVHWRARALRCLSQADNQRSWNARLQSHSASK